MKKINNNILRNYYESYTFIAPKAFLESKEYINSKYNNWLLLDSFLYTKNLKQILNFIKKVVTNNSKKNKILFIFDDDMYYFFKNFVKKQHFITNNVKSGLEFSRSSKYSPLIGCIVYIGKNNEISYKVLKQLNIPFFCFTPKSKLNFDYFNYNMLSFHGSILYLKLLLKEILSITKYK